MIVSDKGTKANCPLPSEGIVLAGGNVDEVNTHDESVEVDPPLVEEINSKSSRMVNMAQLRYQHCTGKTYLGFFDLRKSILTSCESENTSITFIVLMIRLLVFMVTH